MIYDNIKNIDIYKLPVAVKKALGFLNNGNADEGKYVLNDGIYCVISSYQTKKTETPLFEAHRNYIDLQYLFSGVEKIGVATIGKVTVPYSKDNDAELYICNANGSIVLNKGEFCILYPQDLHAPQLAVSATVNVKKAVFKIPVILFAD